MTHKDTIRVAKAIMNAPKYLDPRTQLMAQAEAAIRAISQQPEASLLWRPDQS